MTHKEMKELNKIYCPSYYRGHNLKVALPVLIWLLAGFGTVLGLIFSEYNDYALYAIFVWLAVLIVIFIAVGVASGKRTQRLVCERVAEINEMASDMPFAEAEKALLQNNIITENGFVADEAAYSGRKAVTFNKTHVTFYSSAVATKIVLVAEIADIMNDVIARYVVDRTLYNFIIKKGIYCNFYGDTDVLRTDRLEFVKKNLNIDKSSKIAYVMFGICGAYMHARSAEKITAEKAVLNLLTKTTSV